MNTKLKLPFLRRLVFKMGARAFGVANLARLRETHPGSLDRVDSAFVRAIVMGMPLSRAVLETIVDVPTPVYAHHYAQINSQLDRIAVELVATIEASGHRALPVPASQPVQNHPMAGLVSHKLLGWAAGLGHIGRSTLLVHSYYGAQIRYVSVLTTAPLRSGHPGGADCGACRACVSACPARAIGESASDYNLQACGDLLGEFNRLPFVGRRICGICVRACPGVRRFGKS